jgi:hypothetical protein
MATAENIAQPNKGGFNSRLWNGALLKLGAEPVNSWAAGYERAC